MAFINEQFSILHLLPQSKDMKIKSVHEAYSILDIVEKILKIGDTSLLAFINKKYSKFDPLVGENSCQIRAYMLYYFCQENTNFHQFLNLHTKRDEIKSFLLNIQLLKEKLTTTKTDFMNFSFSDKTSLDMKDFISRNKLEIFFTKEMGLLIMIYFLSKYTIVNDDGIHTGINYTNMQNELQFSKTLSRRLIHLFQVTISNESCLFIRLLAKDISPYYPEYEWIINLLIFTDDDGRMVMSCYLAMDILLKHMAINNTSIVIQHINQNQTTNEGHVDNICYQLNNQTIHKLSPSEIKANQACVVFRGIGTISDNLTLTEKLSEMSMQKVLLASTANHPQYPGKNLESLKVDPFSVVLLHDVSLKEKFYLNKIQKEFLGMKKWTLENGCCMEYPATFFATHIFCDNFSNYINTDYNQNMEYMDRMA